MRRMSHSTKKLDLTGQNYGKLTVLSPAEKIGGRTAWLCRCGCGRQVAVRTDHLRSGHTVTCGCARPDSRGNPAPVGLSRLTYIDGTCVEMLAAKTVRSNNTSRVPGVDWRASKGVWRASICFKGRRVYLGAATVGLKTLSGPGNGRRRNFMTALCVNSPRPSRRRRRRADS